MENGPQTKRIILIVLVLSLCAAGGRQLYSYVIRSLNTGEEQVQAEAAATGEGQEPTETEENAAGEQDSDQSETEAAAKDQGPEHLEDAAAEDQRPEHLGGNAAAEQRPDQSRDAQGFDLSMVPPYSGIAYADINDDVPFFTEADMTTEAFDEYWELDELGRCTGAYACVGPETLPKEGRGEIGSIKPTGWHTVKYEGIDGNYLYNRCHLIGYQLTGQNAEERNLITGTRYMNIEGMLPFENSVFMYVEGTGNHVMYRVRPYFDGDNLLASGVLMEARSVEDPLVQFCAFCYNVQPGVEIDYATGESSGPAFTGTEPEAGAEAAGASDSGESGTAQEGARPEAPGKEAEDSRPEVPGNGSKDSWPEGPEKEAAAGDPASGNKNDDPDQVQEIEAQSGEAEPSDGKEAEQQSGGTEDGRAQDRMTEREVRYIVNTKTGKFHHPSCLSVQDMYEGNKLETSESREELIRRGYTPCRRCRP